MQWWSVIWSCLGIARRSSSERLSGSLHQAGDLQAVVGEVVRQQALVGVVVPPGLRVGGDRRVAVDPEVRRDVGLGVLLPRAVVVQQGPPDRVDQRRQGPVRRPLHRRRRDVRQDVDQDDRRDDRRARASPRRPAAPSPGSPRTILPISAPQPCRTTIARWIDDEGHERQEPEEVEAPRRLAVHDALHRREPRQQRGRLPEAGDDHQRREDEDGAEVRQLLEGVERQVRMRHVPRVVPGDVEVEVLREDVPGVGEDLPRRSAPAAATARR